MKRILHLGTTFILLIGLFANAQEIVWTGSAANNDFFDEGNWKNSATNLAPSSGSIDPGLAINLPLQINTVLPTIVANGEINVGSGSLAIGMCSLTAQSFSGDVGTITINEGAYVTLTDAIPFKTTTPRVQINFTSGLAWIRINNVNPRLVFASYLSQIKVNGSNSSYRNNLRLDNYYFTGCVIRANLASTTPLTVYDGTNLQGTSVGIRVNTIHSGDAIPGAMNEKIESFLLKKGFMVTIADEADGTGRSKNYIASESDLVINVLPKTLQSATSFIRVMPWNWVTKKGRTGPGTDLSTSWRYNWSNGDSSSLEIEQAPMAFTVWGADDAADIALYVAKYNSTHVMAFNEADNCDDQAGQYGNPKLCETDEAVRLYKNLMKTGMRLVSPSCTEGAATGWLKEFHQKATVQDIRIDVIGVHWYDWGGNSRPSTTPNADAVQVFNRFKSYLTTVYNLYKLPIWITEFNANPYRSNAVQLAFMELALPYLETLSYVERYNWFQPNPTPGDETDNANKVGTGEFYTTRPPAAVPILTTVGTTYRNQVSTASIPTATVDSDNNLNLVQFANIALNKPATANSSASSASLPANAVDGATINALWAVNFGNSGSANYTPLPAWIEVDLQGSFTIDSFRIFETSSAVKDFNFQVWDATLNAGVGGWTNALTVTGNPASPLTTYKTISPITTTKVRLFITAHNSTTQVRIFELEVYGKAVSTLGVTSYESKQAFTIYPNPVTNDVLNISGDQEVQSVELYSILGAKINARYENNQVQVSNLAPGVYFLKINDKYSFKFIKK